MTSSRFAFSILLPSLSYSLSFSMTGWLLIFGEPQSEGVGENEREEDEFFYVLVRRDVPSTTHVVMGSNFRAALLAAHDDANVDFEVIEGRRYWMFRQAFLEFLLPSPYPVSVAILR
jgi:hypothetical protein